MKEYILKLCTWVLVLSSDQNCGRTPWSKMKNFNNERIYIEVVRLGIGFVVRPKLGSYDLVKNEEFQHNLVFAIPRPNSTSTRAESNETF